MYNLNDTEKKFILDLIGSVKKATTRRRQVITPPQKRIMESIEAKLTMDNQHQNLR